MSTSFRRLWNTQSIFSFPQLSQRRLLTVGLFKSRSKQVCPLHLGGISRISNNLPLHFLPPLPPATSSRGWMSLGMDHIPISVLFVFINFLWKCVCMWIFIGMYNLKCVTCLSACACVYAQARVCTSTCVCKLSSDVFLSYALPYYCLIFYFLIFCALIDSRSLNETLVVLKLGI